MRRALLAGVVITGLLGLVVAAAGATDDAPAGLWVTLLIALVVLACGAVAVAMLTPTPEQPMQRIRRVTLAWIILTIVTSPFAYGAPLLSGGCPRRGSRWWMVPKTYALTAITRRAERLSRG